MKKLLLIMVMAGLLAMAGISWAEDALTQEECGPFAQSLWVITNTQTSELGRVTEMSFNAPGTCQFVVQFGDGTVENKIVISRSERERMQREAQR